MALIKKTKVTVGEDVEKREPSSMDGGNINWCRYYGKQYGGSLKKKIYIYIYI